MSTHRKTWSPSEKLQIIAYAKANGKVKASREYGVSVNSIYNWQSAYSEHGETGLQRANKPPCGESAELRRLRRENQQLKELVAEKELRLRIKEELLKKSK